MIIYASADEANKISAEPRDIITDEYCEDD